ncbi:MAG: DMT family transporter [Gammaproteobacteria bacterium]|nr:DMT family transporter [Gammaproteobacteria bacterium]
MTEKKRNLIWIPVLFVPLWSTGFIGAKFGLPYAEPFTLLSIRMYITLVAFLLLIYLNRAHWPNPSGALHSLVVGVLVHTSYLGGVFAAISAGMSAGLASLLVGLQPILTALFAWGWMDERVSHRQKAGLAIGLIGVAMVLILGKPGQGTVVYTPQTLGYTSIALLGITLGTLYQKRFCARVNLLTGTFYQYLATAIVMTSLAFLFETRQVQWEPPFVFALLWLVLGLSVGAILLLMRMIREGEAAKVASYFYLTPPVTAIMAWILFGEVLTPWAIGGILVTATGVYLVVKKNAADES